MLLLFFLHNGKIPAKKLLVWLLVLVSMVNVSPLYAATNEVNKQIADQIAAKIDGVDSLSQLSVTDFELNAEEPSNLYLRLYQQKLGNVEELALKNTALVSGHNYFTVRDVVLDQNTDSLNGSIEAQQAQAKEIKQIYEEEQDLAETSTQLLLNTYFFDTYANGDTSDSEFDLVDDLQTIHDLMFVGKPNTYITNDPNLNKRDLFEVSLDNALTIGAGLTPSVTTNAPNATDPQDDPATESQICPADPELLAILTDHRRVVTSSNPDLNQQGQPLTQALEDYTPRPLSDFLQPKERKCTLGDVFCVEIEKVYERTQNYFAGDESCVACQISQINQDLEENLLTKNLYPGKVTGLFGEAAECKEAFFHLPLGLNITIESKPVVSDKNPALDKITNNKPADFERKEQPGDKLGETALLSKTNPTTQNLLEIQERTNKIEKDIASVLRGQESAEAGSELPKQYQGFTQHIQPKMQEFNGYLEKFQLQMLELNQTVNNFANKPQCNA